MRAIAVALTIALTTTAVALAWPQGGRQETPAQFLSGVVRLLTANRYAEAWQSLDPTDQALAPRAVYIACESKSPIPGRLVSLRALAVRRDRIGVAVTLALRIAGAALPQGVRVVLTAHAVQTGRRWAWILPPARRTLYRHGCDQTGGPPA